MRVNVKQYYIFYSPYTTYNHTFFQWVEKLLARRSHIPPVISHKLTVLQALPKVGKFPEMRIIAVCVTCPENLKLFL
jgi:hypothetical protein